MAKEYKSPVLEFLGSLHCTGDGHRYSKTIYWLKMSLFTTRGTPPTNTFKSRSLLVPFGLTSKGTVPSWLYLCWFIFYRVSLTETAQKAILPPYTSGPGFSESSFPFLLFLELVSALLFGEFTDCYKFPFQEIHLYLKLSLLGEKKKKKKNS